MQLLLSVGLVVVGFVLGTFLFSRVGHWLLGVYTVLKVAGAPGQASLASRLASATLGAPGLWIIIATGMFAVSVRSQSWAVWLFGGVCVALAYFSGLSVYLARKAASAARKRGA